MAPKKKTTVAGPSTTNAVTRHAHSQVVEPASTSVPAPAQVASPQVSAPPLVTSAAAVTSPRLVAVPAPSAPSRIGLLHREGSSNTLVSRSGAVGIRRRLGVSSSIRSTGCRSGRPMLQDRRRYALAAISDRRRRIAVLAAVAVVIAASALVIADLQDDVERRRCRGVQIALARQ
jgi:hypothetical protein